MAEEEKQKLAFYRGVRMALEECVELGVEIPVISAPQPVVATPEPVVFTPDATARLHVETLVDSVVGLVSPSSVLCNTGRQSLMVFTGYELEYSRSSFPGEP